MNDKVKELLSNKKVFIVSSMTELMEENFNVLTSSNYKLIKAIEINFNPISVTFNSIKDFDIVFYLRGSDLNRKKLKDKYIVELSYCSLNGCFFVESLELNDNKEETTYINYNSIKIKDKVLGFENNIYKLK